jgi:hypothetical protein
MSISNISTKDNKRKVQKILGNELGHFIKNENGKISFNNASHVENSHLKPWSTYLFDGL